MALHPLITAAVVWLEGWRGNSSIDKPNLDALGGLPGTQVTAVRLRSRLVRHVSVQSAGRLASVSLQQLARLRSCRLLRWVSCQVTSSHMLSASLRSRWVREVSCDRLPRETVPALVPVLHAT